MNSQLGKLTDEYVIIAALPSVGKTSFALELMRHLGAQDIRSSMAQLESSNNRTTARLIANIGSVNTWRLSNGVATEGEFDDARAALATLKTLPINITFAGMGLHQIRAWAQKEKNLGSRLLILDNMKNVRYDAKNKTTPEIFMYMSKELKFIRDDTGLPLIVLHHLATTGDMAWSSDIMRDVDIALYMLESNKSVEESGNGPAIDRVHIKSMKNRDGARYLDFYPQFRKQYQQWKEMAE